MLCHDCERDAEVIAWIPGFGSRVRFCDEHFDWFLEWCFEQGYHHEWRAVPGSVSSKVVWQREGF
jgi:hypothetical protein